MVVKMYVDINATVKQSDIYMLNTESIAYGLFNVVDEVIPKI